MSETIRRGVLIGCGFFAENHLHAWSAQAGAAIVAVCDLDAERARSTAQRFGIDAYYTDASQMLDKERPDFVDIVTTAETHRALVELAVTRANLVICQKPFAESIADARAMVDAAQTAGATLMVHENFRWQLPFIRMRTLMDEGHIGTPHFARFSFRHGYNNYVNQPYLAEIERFTIMDVGLHLFDLARHFLGEVTHLSCHTQRLNPIVRGEDAFTAMLAHEHGATSICDCSFYTRIDPEPFPRTLAWIEGELGSLELGLDLSLTLHTAGGRQSIAADPPVPVWGDRPWHVIQQSVVAFNAHAVDVMNTLAEPQPSGVDNLRTLSLALAAYEAAEGRCTVDMRNWPA